MALLLNCGVYSSTAAAHAVLVIATPRQFGRHLCTAQHLGVSVLACLSLQTFKGHSVLQTLVRCYFSPASSTAHQYVYSGSQDGAVYMWDTQSGELN